MTKSANLSFSVLARSLTAAALTFFAIYPDSTFFKFDA